MPVEHLGGWFTSPADWVRLEKTDGRFWCGLALASRQGGPPAAATAAAMAARLAWLGGRSGGKRLERSAHCPDMTEVLETGRSKNAEPVVTVFLVAVAQECTPGT